MLWPSISSAVGVCQWSLFPESSLPEHWLLFFAKKLELTAERKNSTPTGPAVLVSGGAGLWGAPWAHLPAVQAHPQGTILLGGKADCVTIGMELRGTLDVIRSMLKGLVGQSPGDRMRDKSSSLFSLHHLNWTHCSLGRAWIMRNTTCVPE